MNNIKKIVGRAARAWRTRRDPNTYKTEIRSFDAVAFAAVLEVIG